MAAVGAADAAAGQQARQSASPEPPPDVETVTIEMEAPINDRLGVRIVGGRRTVSSFAHEDAFTAGWRVGDVIVEVNGETTGSNDEVKAAVKKALAENKSDGKPMRFVVRRRKQETDQTRSMLRMTPGTGNKQSVPMLQLVMSLTNEFPVVLFIDGTLKAPNSNLSARAIAILDEMGIPFKAIDVSDEKYNPGAKKAVEELTGQWDLPQLFISGTSLGNAYRMEELQKSGSLKSLAAGAGAFKEASE